MGSVTCVVSTLHTCSANGQNISALAQSPKTYGPFPSHQLYDLPTARIFPLWPSRSKRLPLSPHTNYMISQPPEYFSFGPVAQNICPFPSHQLYDLPTGTIFPVWPSRPKSLPLSPHTNYMICQRPEYFHFGPAAQNVCPFPPTPSR